MKERKKMYKILSIDGGGIKGVFPISFLASIEEAIEDKIGNYFDLIVGTSTGGIIALGLGLNFSSKELLRFYEDFGPKVFERKQNLAATTAKSFQGFLPGKKTRKVMEETPYLFTNKYDSAVLKQQLESQFGQRRLGESKTRLVIPSFDVGRGEPHVYKTSHNERLQMDYKQRIVDVALATTAAPTYFSTHQSENGNTLVDGGLYANNPTGLAVVEAISLLDWKPENFKVLSIGCTNSPFSIDSNKRDMGLGDWAKHLVDTMMLAQSKQSMGTAYLLANHRENENIFRIDHTVQPGKFTLDGIDGIRDLKAFGASIAREQIPTLRKVFFNERVKEPFVPVYKLD